MLDVSIYFPNESDSVFRYHLNRVAGEASTSQHWSYYNDITTFISDARGRRIACFQIPYPYNSSIEDQINQLYQHVDKILIIGSELHPDTVDFIRRFDRDRIFYYICGYLNFRLDSSFVEKFFDWFTTSVHFYKNIRPSILYQLKPYDIKPYAFDALLGRKKLHRDRAYDFIQKNNLTNCGIVTYINDYQINFSSNDSTSWIWGNPDVATVENIDQVQWTVDRIQYHGYEISLSQIIPIDIYNQTAYSLICETNYDNDYVFFTEKTVKPIIARRLFVLLGNRFSLERLRGLGFRTFDSIIDESYDAIEDIVERHTAALEQLRWLCEQDQATILEQCREIVDHNFDLMYGHDWYNRFTQTFGQHFF